MSKIFDDIKGDNLESEITIFGLKDEMFFVSWVTCLAKFVNHRGIFAILFFIENPPPFHANSTGGTLTQSYP
jgi:hypothetical protein